MVPKSYLIGVDVGGTFTDCVVIDDGGAIVAGKAPSTPDDFSEGVLESIRVACEGIGRSTDEVLSRTTILVHASTIAENAILNRAGAKSGLIATKGFEDTLLIMRGIGRVAGLGEAEILHMVKTNKPVPIIPGALIEGVVERVDYKGSVVVPLKVEEAKAAVQRLVAKGIESLAVCLLWSFMNPKHEQQIGRLASEMYPNMPVTLSSELVPVLGEYERSSTVALNAYLRPAIFRYLKLLEEKLLQNGYGRQALIMQAYGGVLPAREAASRPVGMIESGPTAGVIGCKLFMDLLGVKSAIATDMGGTTFKMGVIYDGTIEYAREPTFSQYRILTPKVEVASIGAGGGTIAWIEPVSGLLKVGPTSAGAKPGPVCYDRGGGEPTVTDADLILGYLNPNYFLGGRIKLNKERAERCLKERLASPLGMDVVHVASSIYSVVNSQMSDLIRNLTIERGYDPREAVLFAYGGAGPVHAGILAEELGAKAALVPATASVHSALGLLASDVLHVYELSDRLIIPAEPERVNSNFAGLEEKALRDLSSEGFSAHTITLQRAVYMRYRRQVHEILTPVKGGELSEHDLQVVCNDFERLYERAYGKGAGYRQAGMEIVTFRLEGRGALSKPSLTKYPHGDGSIVKPKEKREVYFPGQRSFLVTDIFDFQTLKPGNAISGPAVIETPSTTIVIHPGHTATVDEYLNVCMKFRD